MAEKITRTLIDDMEDGEVVADGGTVPFGLDGKQYEIDLSKKNAGKLRDFLQPFIKSARAAGKFKPPAAAAVQRKSSGGSGYGSEQLSAVRQWARKNGFPDLSDKGRVPADVLESYEAAHRGGEESLFSAS